MNKWYYLSPVAQTIVASMLEFGFTYEGVRDLDPVLLSDESIEGWSLIIDEGDYFDDVPIPYLNAIWLETGDLFYIPLSQISPTISFILLMNTVTREELSFQETDLALELAAELIRGWQRSHYQSPGQLQLFST